MLRVPQTGTSWFQTFGRTAKGLLSPPPSRANPPWFTSWACFAGALIFSVKRFPSFTFYSPPPSTAWLALPNFLFVSFFMSLALVTRLFSFYLDELQVSPEIVEGKSQYSRQADIYSLGKLFVDMAGRASSLHGLRHLGLACMRRNPDSRPKLSIVYKKLDKLCSRMARTKLPPLPPP